MAETTDPASDARVFGRQLLLSEAASLDAGRRYEEAAMLRRCKDDLIDMDAIAWRRSQHNFLYDQWGLRIVHCEKTEPHDWHGWVGNNTDLRCPGIPDRG